MILKDGRGYAHFAKNLHVGSARSIDRGDRIYNPVDVAANHLNEGVHILPLRQVTELLDEIEDVGANVHRGL